MKVANLIDDRMLARIRERGADWVNNVCERAGLWARAIYDRTKEVMEFFGFPFDGLRREGDCSSTVRTMQIAACMLRLLQAANRRSPPRIR